MPLASSTLAASLPHGAVSTQTTYFTPGFVDVGELGDAGRVVRRHHELQVVGGEDGGVALGAVGVDDGLHGVLVGGGQHVGRRALGDLLGQRRAGVEREPDVDAGVVGLEVLRERA